MKALTRAWFLPLIVVPTLPITFVALISHNPLFPLIQQSIAQQRPCTGRHNYATIWNDEILNLGLHTPDSQPFDIFDFDAAELKKAMRRRMGSTHPDKTNDPASVTCYRAAAEAAGSLCAIADPETFWWTPADCRRDLMWRQWEAVGHWKKTACELGKESKKTQRALSVAADDACNRREWQMLQRNGRSQLTGDVLAFLDPRFTWKKKIYDEFRLAEYRIRVPGRCFYEGEFHYYTSLAQLPSPCQTPSAMQWRVVWMTVGYCGFVAVMCWFRSGNKPWVTEKEGRVRRHQVSPVVRRQRFFDGIELVDLDETTNDWAQRLRPRKRRKVI